MTGGERDTGLGQRHARAHDHERDQQRVALMPRGGVRQALLDRRPVRRGQDHRATAGRGHERGRELLDALGAEREEHEQPGAGGQGAAA